MQRIGELPLTFSAFYVLATPDVCLVAAAHLRPQSKEYGVLNVVFERRQFGTLYAECTVRDVLVGSIMKYEHVTINLYPLNTPQEFLLLIVIIFLLCRQYIQMFN